VPPLQTPLGVLVIPPYKTHSRSMLQHLLLQSPFAYNKRADLPPANSEAIYKRMQTEREREAKEFRAQGAEIAQKIRSTADKDVTVILAQANKKSEIMKGEGDGERNKIFANAFGRDPQFFAFYRAMQAYEKALIGGETSLVLSPDSDFFKFFGKSIKPAVKR